MKHVYSAGIVPFFKGNISVEYLLLHYPAGHWDFPKGHIEEGETKKETALRELHEETGLRVRIIDEFAYEFSYHFRAYVTQEVQMKTVYFFTGEVKKKDIILSHEHIDFIWLPFEQAMEKITYKNAQILLSQVHEFLQEKYGV